jgi:hypothetical protein
MATDTIELAGLDGGPVSLATKQLDELDSRVQGRLLRAGDQGWDEAVLTWRPWRPGSPPWSSSRPPSTTSLGDPIVDLVTPKPYVAMQSMLNAMEPKWLHRYWKAEFLPGMSSGFCDSFCDRALQVTSPLSHSLVFHLTGALKDREGDDGAVGNRDARYIASFAGTWPPDAPPTPMWPGSGTDGSGSGPSRPAGTTSTCRRPTTTPPAPPPPTAPTTVLSSGSRPATTRLICSG